MQPVDPRFGEALARHRRARRISLRDLARMVHYSHTQVWEWERGRAIPTTDAATSLDGVLHAGGELVRIVSVPAAIPRVVPIREVGGWVERRTLLAASLAALGVPLGAVAPDGRPPNPAGQLVDEMSQRLLAYPSRDLADTAPTAAAVASAVRQVRDRFAAADVRSLTTALPAALDVAQARLVAVEGGDAEPAAAADLAAAHTIAASTAIKLGRMDLAWVAADRAMLAAGRSGNALAQAEASRQVSILCRKAGRPDQTMRVALGAADQLRTAGLSTPDGLSTYGLLLLSAGYAAAVSGDRARSGELLAEADAAGNRLGQGVWRGEFGTANVAIYRVSVEWALGRPGAAIAVARSLPAAQLPTPERAQRFWVDVARAFQRDGKPVECFKALLAAERAAPQAVRVRPVVHSVTTWLLDAPTTVGLSGLREFALRVTAA